METIFKSEVFKDHVYRRKFNKDFLSNELSEHVININTPEVSGNIKELNLDGIFIVQKDVYAHKGYRFLVENNFSVFKLHFEMSGGYSYVPKGVEEPLVVIPDSHFNMFYLPNTNGALVYKGAHRRTFEVFFTIDLVKKIIGEEYEKIVKRIDNAIKNKRPINFWESSPHISSKMYRMLEEIRDCAYTGHLKKTYLQSKITAMLVDFLISANSEQSQENEIPRKDLENLKIVEGYIKNNLKETLSIAELSIIAGFNASKLKRDFKKVYGKTIFKYITHLRMLKAKSKIQKEGLTVSQAAYEVGYSNPQHFTKAFKKTLGYLPGTLKT